MQKNMLVTRREVVIGSVAFGSATLLGTLHLNEPQAFASDGKIDSSSSEQYGFLLDITKCVGCRKCIDACNKVNDIVDESLSRRAVRVYTDSHRNNVYVSTSCMHCAKPSCAAVCPAGAIKKTDAGIVSVDRSRCIGCKYCHQACPYEVPKYNDGGMDKCDCCLGAGVPAGEEPNCVKACLFDALRYGPLSGLRASAGDNVRPIAEENDPSCLVKY